MNRYVIIGAGVAGIAAAESLRLCDSAASLQMVCEEAEGYYSRPGLAYYLTGEIDEEHLQPFEKPDFQRLRIQRITARAVRLYPKERQVELQGGTRLPYDGLLIAAGAASAPLPLSGADAKGVLKLDTLHDARLIMRSARKGRTAVVVGGGITALEIVEGLAAQGVKTHYLLRSERYWSNVLDETESRLVESRLEEHGVQIHHHSSLAAVLTRAGRVAGVRTQEGEEIICTLLAAAIGVLPRKELAEAASIQCERGILVDETLQTSVEGIYAAGDVAQVYDPLSGKKVLDSLWGSSREQGKVAGFNLAAGAGLKQVYQRLPSLNVTRLAGLATTIIGAVGRGRDDDLAGISRGDSESWRLLPEAEVVQELSGTNRLRLLVGPSTLLGALIMGDQTLSRPLQDLVIHQVDIRPIREQLLKPGAAAGPLVTRLWKSRPEGSSHAAH